MKPREQAQVVEERVVAQIHHDPSLCLFASYLTIKKRGAPISSFERVTPNFYIRIGCSFNVPFWAFLRHDISDPRTFNMRSYFGKKLRMHDAGTKLPQTCLMSIMSELIHQVSPCNLSHFDDPRSFSVDRGAINT